MSKPERGAFATGQRRMRLLLNLMMQSILLLVLLAAAVLSRHDPPTMALYLLAAIVPVGFAVVYVLAWRRGERIRLENRWTPAWEKAETRRNYAWLGAVALVFIAGALAMLML